mgnify:CR=1 FL=1
MVQRGISPKISYKQFFNMVLPKALQATIRWLKKNPNIHIEDFIIGGPETYNPEWQITIYYFEDEND